MRPLTVESDANIVISIESEDQWFPKLTLNKSAVSILQGLQAAYSLKQSHIMESNWQLVQGVTPFTLRQHPHDPSAG